MCRGTSPIAEAGSMGPNTLIILRDLYHCSNHFHILHSLNIDLIIMFSYHIFMKKIGKEIKFFDLQHIAHHFESFIPHISSLHVRGESFTTRIFLLQQHSNWKNHVIVLASNTNQIQIIHVPSNMKCFKNILKQHCLTFL